MKHFSRFELDRLFLTQLLHGWHSSAVNVGYFVVLPQGNQRCLGGVIQLELEKPKWRTNRKQEAEQLTLPTFNHTTGPSPSFRAEKLDQIDQCFEGVVTHLPSRHAAPILPALLEPWVDSHFDDTLVERRAVEAGNRHQRVGMVRVP